MRNWIFALIAATAIAPAALAQDVPRDQPVAPRPEPTVKQPSVSAPRGKAPIIGSVGIGERAPDFELDTSTGRTEKLSRLRGYWVLLVFGDRYRTLMALDSLDTDARPLGARVVGVCHEKQQTLTSAAAREKYDMLLFADATGEVSAMYGLFDWQHGTTTPGLVVIDREGTVRLVVLGRLFPRDQMLDLLKFATETTEG